MNLCDLEEIKYLLRGHGFQFSKSMGQNFLVENWVPEDIAKVSGADKNTGVLEIGPGIGCLTRELAHLAEKVVAVELDKALLPILAVTLQSSPNASVVSGDVLQLNLPQFVAEQFGEKKPMVCANLPYNITSPILTTLIDSASFSKITVMIQKEVAQRIAASAGDSAFGGFSIYCQYHCKAELLFDVPADCFYPAPKVTSAVLQLTPQAPPPEVDDEKHFFQIVKGSFAQRRKTLQNSLSSSMSQYSKEDVVNALEICGLRADVRGQALSISDFARLSRTLRGLPLTV
ncbi:MAG: 16S rRNA (adenine(1518)-N(6)/adenine(1519)-N(6))-dimethyltransferase RsmA [Eubacteriales bacterium]